MRQDEYIQGEADLSSCTRLESRREGELSLSSRLRVVATDDSAASIFRSVGRAIRLVLAAAQAEDLLIRLKQLNKVWVTEAFGTRRSIGIILSTFIMLGELVRVTINGASYLDISAFPSAVVGRLDKTFREDLGIGNGIDGFCAEGNGAVFILGDTTAWIGRQEEAETRVAFDGHCLGCRLAESGR